MRKIVLQMNITIDGFVGNLNGELDWMLPEVDENQIKYLNSLTKSTDTILIGRKMAEESIPYWRKIAESDEKSQETEYAKFFTDTKKLVFTKTLKSLKGNNVILENNDMQEVITGLKQESGQDMIVYGGAKFVSSLITEKLIDELNLFVHPIAIGKGLPIFTKKSKFQMIRSELYSNGISLSKYVPI